jgi:hypothetical protein
MRVLSKRIIKTNAVSKIAVRNNFIKGCIEDMQTVKMS